MGGSFLPFATCAFLYDYPLDNATKSMHCPQYILFVEHLSVYLGSLSHLIYLFHPMADNYVCHSNVCFKLCGITFKLCSNNLFRVSWVSVLSAFYPFSFVAYCLLLQVKKLYLIHKILHYTLGFFLFFYFHDKQMLKLKKKKVILLINNKFSSTCTKHFFSKHFCSDSGLCQM